MNCYDVLVEIVQKQYERIHIDLCNKTIRVGRQIIIENGQVRQNKIIVGSDSYEFNGLIEKELDINELYAQYKVSLPSERDRGRHYFKALSVNELTDTQMVTSLPRLEARIRLEAYILLASASGILKWEDDSKWFWQGNDKDFVILKRYVV